MGDDTSSTRLDLHRARAVTVHSSSAPLIGLLGTSQSPEKTIVGALVASQSPHAISTREESVPARSHHSTHVTRRLIASQHYRNEQSKDRCRVNAQGSEVPGELAVTF